VDNSLEKSLQPPTDQSFRCWQKCECNVNGVGITFSVGC